MSTSLETPTSNQRASPGGIIEKEAAIRVSNVQVGQKNGVAGRVDFKVASSKKEVSLQQKIRRKAT